MCRAAYRIALKLRRAEWHRTPLLPLVEYISTHANLRAGSASVRGRVPDAVARQNGAAKRLGGVRPARAAGLHGREPASPARGRCAERGAALVARVPHAGGPRA